MKLRRPKRRTIFLSAALVLAALGFSMGIFVASQAEKKVSVPAGIAEQVLFPVYLPAPLPGTYQTTKKSFRVTEGALLFSVSSESGKQIHFAEQAKPDGFDFSGFYKEQLTQTKKLQGTPYTSVLGKTQKQGLLLSVITDETWLIITSSTASEADLRHIAEHIKKQ
jgi:hypothetical protein